MYMQLICFFVVCVMFKTVSLGNVPSGSINMEILKSNRGKTKEEVNEDSDSECSKDSHYDNSKDSDSVVWW